MARSIVDNKPEYSFAKRIADLERVVQALQSNQLRQTTFNKTSGTGTQNITDIAYNDITGLTLPINLDKPANILFYAIVAGFCKNTGGVADTLLFKALIDAVQVGTIMATPGIFIDSTHYLVVQASTMDTKRIEVGSHTFKLQAANSSSLASVVQIDQCEIGYITLGV